MGIENRFGKCRGDGWGSVGGCGVGSGGGALGLGRGGLGRVAR